MQSAFPKLSKRLSFSLIFTKRTIDCARDDDEKDTGIDFEIDSDHPRTDLVRWIWKTDILVTANDYEWNDDWDEIKKLPTKHIKLLSSFRAIGPLDS